MRILFTGASSFTGFWFVRELSLAGHSVVATFRKKLDSYEGVRRERVRLLAEHCEPAVGCGFGSGEFLELIRGCKDWDVLCHHAADVSDYKSSDFDVVAALSNNTRNVSQVLKALRERGCRRVVLTGSIFEQGEGVGSGGLPAFSPYGMSKGLTADVFRYHAEAERVRLGKFVIPNPFGPYEEPRFTAYLMRTWLDGKVALVNTPAYVRDNIHSSLLARCYVKFLESLPADPGFSTHHPSGYVETQGAFAQHFAAEMRTRFDMPCELDLKHQVEFAEPGVRINMEPAAQFVSNWDETAAWDEVAGYYREMADVGSTC
ncbi:MAG: NAD-dependent epimerase/dehydratase family protein [Phycisphaerae bacterium]